MTHRGVVVQFEKTFPQGLKPTDILRLLRHDWSRALSRRVQTAPLPVADRAGQRWYTEHSARRGRGFPAVRRSRSGGAESPWKIWSL